MSCPNNCDEPSEFVFAKIPREAFAELQERLLGNRKGIVDYRLQFDKKGVILELVVKQDAYKTNNYFMYRDEFEKHRNCSITDKSDGEVSVLLEGPYGCLAHRCKGCGVIYENRLGDIFTHTYDDHDKHLRPI